MKKPSDNAPITEVLEYYAETDRLRGKRLAEFADYIEDCFSYTMEVKDDDH